MTSIWCFCLIVLILIFSTLGIKSSRFWTSWSQFDDLGQWSQCFLFRFHGLGLWSWSMVLILLILNWYFWSMVLMFMFFTLDVDNSQFLSFFFLIQWSWLIVSILLTFISWFLFVVLILLILIWCSWLMVLMFMFFISMPTIHNFDPFVFYSMDSIDGFVTHFFTLKNNNSLICTSSSWFDGLGWWLWPHDFNLVFLVDGLNPHELNLMFWLMVLMFMFSILDVNK